MGRRERTGVLSCLREGLLRFPRERKVAPKERRGFRAGNSLFRISVGKSRRGRARGELCRGTGARRHLPDLRTADGGGVSGTACPCAESRAGMPIFALRASGNGGPATADSRRTHTPPACAGAEPPEPRRSRRTASQCLSSELQNYFVEMCSIMFAFVQGNPIPLRQS